MAFAWLRGLACYFLCSAAVAVGEQGEEGEGGELHRTGHRLAMRRGAELLFLRRLFGFGRWQFFDGLEVSTRCLFSENIHV